MSHKTKTTATKKEATPALVPKLRFPEYRGAEGWREGQIADIAVSESSSRALNKLSLKSEGYPVYGADSCVGLIDFFDQADDYIAIVKDGSGVGRLALKKGKSSILGTLAYIKCKPSSETDLTWLYYCLNSLDLRQFIKGSGIPHIYFSDYATHGVLIPPPPEQQKIASCLSSVDELIAAQARKVDALQTHKKGLMQQLFPRESETQPRLRFPEFQNAGEWVCRRLGDFATVAASGDLDPATFSPERSDGHCFPIYSNAVEKEGIYGFSSVAKCKANSVTITARGTLGRAFLRRTDFVGIGRLIVVSNFESEADSAFLTECWDHLAVIPQEVTSIPQLTAVAARATALPFPSLPEQQRIADCLTSLDALIAAQTQKHEALKTHKKGLMQQLFPSPEEVEA